MASMAQGGKVLSGPDKAAFVLMSLDEASAAAVLRHLDEATIGAITNSMAGLETLSTEDACQIFGELVSDMETAGSVAAGSFSGFRRMLTAAFGEKKASDILERLLRSGSSTIDVLTKVDPKTLADQIKDERPQLIAVLLGHMNRASAVACLRNLPEHTVTEVVFRYARIEMVQAFALTELREMLSEMLGGHIASRTTMLGGVRQAADLLNGMGGTVTERTLAQIREHDAPLADRIRENMFTFDDLLRLTDQALQLVIRSVDQGRLGAALRAASTQMRERVLANVAQKEAVILRDDVENGPMVVRSEAQAAQRALVEAAMALAQEGKISLGGEEDML